MYAPVVSSKPIPHSSVFRQKDPKPLHFGAAHIYMPYIREYPPPRVLTPFMIVKNGCRKYNFDARFTFQRTGQHTSTKNF